MAMAWVWTLMVTASVVFGLINGTVGAVGNAALEGAAAAVELCLTMAGIMCLWMGVMEVMKRSGLAEKLSRLLRPLLGRLYPDFKHDRETMDAISANVSANLLGLGNAATPLGLAAMKELARENPEPGTASQAMVTFVVLNTASLQILPTTNAYLRLAAGSKEPMEILPAVWLASTVSICVGVFMSRALRGRKQRRELGG